MMIFNIPSKIRIGTVYLADYKCSQENREREREEKEEKNFP